MSFIQLNSIVKEFQDPVRGTKTLAIDDVTLQVEKKEFELTELKSQIGRAHV